MSARYRHRQRHRQGHDGTGPARRCFFSMRLISLSFLSLLAALLVPVGLSLPALSQEPPPAAESVIETATSAADDRRIEQRIETIYSQIETLDTVEVTVAAGVVTLTGTVADTQAQEEAASIAGRVSGVVAVRNELIRDISVAGRLTPAGDKVQGLAGEALALVPLIGIALLMFALFASAGLFLAGREGLWRRVTPNTFIAGMVQAIIRFTFMLIGIILALTILDAVALLGAFLGAAGVIGLAIGFAVRDTIENFIASIMMSLRQPFRPNDLVQIGDRLGNVVRLTSRATVLMTPDGNHLRIPNAAVYKATIENFTRNPERRFEFRLGVDAADDPQAAIDIAIAKLRALPFVLADPPPAGWIENVGDSNIVLTLTGWIDQRQTDLMKARSQAIRVAKSVLEAQGFSLPEPIYRLRIEGLDAGDTGTLATLPQPPAETRKPRPSAELDIADTSIDRSLEEKVAEERAGTDGDDLLNPDAPTEFGDAGTGKSGKTD